MCFISAKLDIYVVKICRPKAYILDRVCFENSFYVYRTCANEHLGMSATGIQTIDALGKNMDHEDDKALKCCTHMTPNCVTCGLWSNVRKVSCA